MSTRKRRDQKLNSDMLLNLLLEESKNLKDSRNKNGSYYNLTEILMSAFSIFFTCSSSFLENQRRLEEMQGNNNARTCFHVNDIPSTNQIKNVLDNSDYTPLNKIFMKVFDKLKNVQVIDNFKTLGNHLLLSLDGTQYFSSSNIHCKNCTVKVHSNGKKTYSHTMLVSALVHPNMNVIIPSVPEFIIPQDGHEKQDCEIAAAKRFVDKNRDFLKNNNIIILGDDLFSRQPFCQQLLKENIHFIFTCKESSHQILHDLASKLDLNKYVIKTKNKKKHIEYHDYRFINDVPLRGGNDSINVNLVYVKIYDENKKLTYSNSFVTDLAIDKTNVKQIVAAARAKWKIENENNNTLKTKGYHFEHNYGHGSNNLACFLVTLLLLAFLFHSVLDLLDENYINLRQRLGTRKAFFNDIKALTSYICFQSYAHLLTFMWEAGKEQVLPVPPRCRDEVSSSYLPACSFPAPGGSN